MPWLSRLFFVLVAAIAIAGLVSGTACTRRGKNNPLPPTTPPLSEIFVNRHTGSDTTGNGSETSPYKTLTKAVSVAAESKDVSPTGVTIDLAPGDYSKANGEKFPIVLPAGVSVSGHNYGHGPMVGAFIDGSGEEKTYEKLVRAPARSAFATLEVSSAGDVGMNDVYVGAAKLSLPNASAAYASVYVFGTLTGSESSFDAGTVSTLLNISGVLVPGGSFTCSSCAIHGNDFGVGALSVPMASPSPTASPVVSPGVTGPSITLTHSNGDSTIDAAVVDILTDGTADVTVSGETFLKASYAYKDALTGALPGAPPGAVDFGGGAGGSSGSNSFVGSRVTEISVTRRNSTVYALDDHWNPSTQGATRNGIYPQTVVFPSGTKGANVTVATFAKGSNVTVGPAVVPTPSPSINPSFSPSPFPSISPTP